MPDFQPYIHHLPLFALVVARFSGLFLFSPILSSAMVPRQARVALLLGLSLAVYPSINLGSAPAEISLFDMVPSMFAELVIGMTIGLVASIPLMTAQLAGHTMGQQMGLGLASVFNPAIDIEGDNLGQLLFVAAISTYIVGGGFDQLFHSLILSFDRVAPMTFSVSRAPLELLTGVVTSGFEVAIRASLPVLAILTLETIAMGFVSRSLPAINVMVLGFPIRILIGIMAIIGCIALINEAIAADSLAAIDAINEWIRSLSK